MGALTSKRKETSLDGEEICFDHFQVLRAIGKGSFGKVCIVQKRDSKQMFAMKYMNKSQCEARDALNNVFREIEILASLRHPFLVNLWFSFQDEEDMFMVVDLLLGGDLRYHVQQGVQFSDEAIRLYIMEVATALQYLHVRNIIHRDIKPDNLLLDEEGHVHLTDFNIATVLREDQLATSMSGTKPYMAPEVFECVADTCPGYGYAVDWWSLGVTAYEVRRGRRPYDIHSSTSLQDVRMMFTQQPKFPQDCDPGLMHLISRLLCVNPEKRVVSIEELATTYIADLPLEDVLGKKTSPPFTPPKDHLNCDPTFELEEMIIESRPLHKKKKRLSKQKSLRETNSSTAGIVDGESQVYEGLLIFNREREEEKREREKREQEWQAELEHSMKMSDPTGHGCDFTGSNCGTPSKHCSRRTTKEEGRRELDDRGTEGGGGEGGGGGSGGCGKERTNDNTSNSSSLSSVLSSPTDRTPLPKITVSPSNVRARIAGSPKVKVRGSTVTIESPKSSSTLTKSSTQQLKERLRELKADQKRQTTPGSESDCSDVTQSDDLTLTGRRSSNESPNKRTPAISPERQGKDLRENFSKGKAAEGSHSVSVNEDLSKRQNKVSTNPPNVRSVSLPADIKYGQQTLGQMTSKPLLLSQTTEINSCHRRQQQPCIQNHLPDHRIHQKMDHRSSCPIKSSVRKGKLRHSASHEETSSGFMNGSLHMSELPCCVDGRRDFNLKLDLHHNKVISPGQGERFFDQAHRNPQSPNLTSTDRRRSSSTSRKNGKGSHKHEIVRASSADSRKISESTVHEELMKMKC